MTIFIILACAVIVFTIRLCIFVRYYLKQKKQNKLNTILEHVQDETFQAMMSAVFGWLLAIIAYLTVLRLETFYQ
jgi:heme/copper-type cytochrome/quinol oxidase subunit 4